MTSVSSTASLLTSSTTAGATSSSSSASTSTSDIDWDGLIEEAVAAKLAKADTIDLKITANEAKSAAYESMSTLLSAVLDAAQTLRAPSGSSLASTDVFNARSAYLTASGSADASSTLAATVESGAETGSYELTVSQLAKAHKVVGDTVASKSSDLGYAGTFTIGSDDAAVEVEITDDMSLAEIAEAINATTETSGVKASVLQVSTSGFRLVLTGASVGTTMTATAGTGDNVLTSLGILDADGGAFAEVLQEPAIAIFAIDGIEITRASNDIDDVIDGVTLHLYQVTADDATITVEIGTDLSAVKEQVVALVDAYNAYRDFAYAQQQLPTDDNEDSTVLFGDGTLRNINTALANALGSSQGKQSLALLGITFDSTNHLELDEDVLDNALLDDVSAVQKLLAFQMTSSASDLLLLARGTSVPADFTLDIVTNSSGSITSASVGGDSALFTISGTRITGKEGTAYEGFTFVYAGSDSKSVDLSFSTGIAEQLYNISDAATDADSGTLTSLIDNLADADDALSAKSDDIRTAAETYRSNLTQRYASYQAAISQAESLQDYLTTLLDSWNSSS
jgi:flagellar hook-associated protein 2